MYRDFEIKPVSPIHLPTKVLVKDKIYLFGGNQETISGRPDMVMILGIGDNGRPKWTFELASGLSRPALSTMGMSGCFDQNEEVYLFGGFSVPPRRNLTQHHDSNLDSVSKAKKKVWRCKNYNTLFKYNVMSNAYEAVFVPEDHMSSRTVPSGRYGSTLLYSKDTFGLYLLGGASGDGLVIDLIHHDLWKFDLVASCWERIACVRTPSPALAFHTANMTPDGKRMVIFGGLTFAGSGSKSPNMGPVGKFGSFKEGKSPKIQVSNQLWICYLENLTWRRVKVVSNVKPTRRFLHDATLVGSKMLFSFGSSKYDPGKIETAKKRSKDATTSTCPAEEEEIEVYDHPSGPIPDEGGLGRTFSLDMDWKSEMRKVFTHPKRSIYMFDFDENKWYKIHKVRKKPHKKKKKKKKKKRKKNSENNGRMKRLEDDDEEEEVSHLVETEAIRLVNYSTRVGFFPISSARNDPNQQIKKNEYSLILFGDLNRKTLGVKISHPKYLELVDESLRSSSSTTSTTTTETGTTHDKRTYSPPCIPHHQRRRRRKKGEDHQQQQEEEEEEVEGEQEEDIIHNFSKKKKKKRRSKRLKKKNKKKKDKPKPSVSSFVVLNEDPEDEEEEEQEGKLISKKNKESGGDQQNISGIKKNVFTTIE